MATTNGAARLQHAVHLAQQARQVVDVGERVRGDDEVDRRAGGEAEVGELAVVALDVHLGALRPRRARAAMPVGRGSRAIAFAPAAAMTIEFGVDGWRRRCRAR